ncbi:MAG: tetratricopeptide repeat protein [Pseudomonadota bacterium]
MTRLDWIIFAAALLCAGAVYAMIGRPGYGDQPMAARTAELAAKSPADMTLGETLARLEGLVRERPDDPEPHFFIGQLLMQQGRDEDAVRAFQSALRRDGQHVPALIGLGDAFVRQSGGEVPDEAAQIYTEVVRLDPGQARAAFLIGVSAWQSGERDAARAHWQGYRQAIVSAPQLQSNFDQLVAAFTASEDDETLDQPISE